MLSRATGLTVDKTLSFNVEIKDKNDNSPVFKPETTKASISENANQGTENTYYCIYEHYVCSFVC